MQPGPCSPAASAARPQLPVLQDRDMGSGLGGGKVGYGASVLPLPWGLGTRTAQGKAGGSADGHQPSQHSPLSTRPFQVLPVFLLRVQPGPRVHRAAAPPMVRGWGLARPPRPPPLPLRSHLPPGTTACAASGPASPLPFSPGAASSPSPTYLPPCPGWMWCTWPSTTWGCRARRSTSTLRRFWPLSTTTGSSCSSARYAGRWAESRAPVGGLGAGRTTQSLSAAHPPSPGSEPRPASGFLTRLWQRAGRGLADRQQGLGVGLS